MTKKQVGYKIALIKQIHCSPAWRDVYRDHRGLYEHMLMAHFEVKSSKDLSIDELKSLLEFMNGKSAIKKVLATNNQLAYIVTLWQKNSMYKDMFSLLKFIKNKFGLDVKELKDISKRDVTKVIGAVKNIKPLKHSNNINYMGPKV